MRKGNEMTGTPLPFNAEQEPPMGQTPRPRAMEGDKPTVLVSFRLPEDSIKVLEQLAEIDSTDPDVARYPYTVADELRGAVDFHLRNALPVSQEQWEAARARNHQPPA